MCDPSFVVGRVLKKVDILRRAHVQPALIWSASWADPSAEIQKPWIGSLWKTKMQLATPKL
jgi:hypothetical protein